MLGMANRCGRDSPAGIDMKTITTTQWIDLVGWQRADQINRSLIIKRGGTMDWQKYDTYGNRIDNVFVCDAGLVVQGILWEFSDNLTIRKRQSKGPAY